MPKFIHLVDDEKFIKYAFESFSKLDEVTNEYICISDKEKLTHIDFDCRILNNSYLKSAELIGDLNHCDLIILV